MNWPYIMDNYGFGWARTKKMSERLASILKTFSSGRPTVVSSRLDNCSSRAAFWGLDDCRLQLSRKQTSTFTSTTGWLGGILFWSFLITIQIFRYDKYIYNTLRYTWPMKTAVSVTGRIAVAKLLCSISPHIERVLQAIYKHSHAQKSGNI